MGDASPARLSVVSTARAAMGRHARVATVLTACAVLLGGCTGLPSPSERRGQADRLATSQGWQPQLLASGPFKLMSYAPKATVVSDSLTVYIEGDGFAWATSSRPSLNPTPRTPVALQLALADSTHDAVAYLARPCQYIDAEVSGCDQRFWTEARFAPEVIEASSQAVDLLKRRYGARQLTLVGYSGGGAVAALVAARRSDVKLLVTVAGNLDHVAWTSLHGVSPLSASLNPANFRPHLENVHQVHLVGGRDIVVPPSIAEHFVQGFPETKQPQIVRIPNYDHYCCWAQDWQAILPRIESGGF